MSDFNTLHNRAVWFDIPVSDLARATRFYTAVLGIAVHQEAFQGMAFAVLDHGDGNGGCLVVEPASVGMAGILVYFNVDGRIAEAVREVERLGGRVVEGVQPIGPHGFRAIVVDSEGNRIALHSMRAPA